VTAEQDVPAIQAPEKERVMAERLRFGIIGCGVIGPTHAEALTTVPEAHLVAVADVVPERAAQLAAKHGATPYSDARQMLEREQLDVVDVCTPSGMHGEHACLVMRSGRHVIVEKPMEITRSALDEMLRVQRESGVKLAVISQHRFDAATQEVQRLSAAGSFGRLVLGTAQIPWWRSQKYYDSGAWRGTWALDGGGVLMNQSIHSIDVLQWLMGRVTHVTAYTRTLAHQMETEDVAVAVLRFANGALGAITATTGAYPGVGTRVEVFGDRGSAVIENDRLGFLQMAQEGQQVGDYGIGVAERAQQRATVGDLGGATAADPKALAIAGHGAQIQDMIRAIREDGSPLVDGEAGRRPVEIILAIYESARTGREVAV
jgi:UDP-N-acetyl-2-amino-2-deoxyglucuronate dehydrogenase